MKQRALCRLLLGVTIVSSLALAGCGSSPSSEQSEDPEVTVDTPPTADSAADSLSYNLRRLADRDFVDSYGDGENEKIWYTAAENLGEIGKQAIPPLIERLDSPDEYEVMLALYALQLASQDEALAEDIGDNYLRLPSVLNPRANPQNRAIALSWWQQYEHLWSQQ
ncbi:hypothetical protein CWE12_10840 [Aliidiomarina sedimenti]|uniref:HEAT repeat domain-containing protein n=1 Tax=Aliidiomarina sedimenti TaxID=1933879 RepID=A0ABY0BXB8_9GAMM|nr:HEAT repeat domain-containing protein [Aliidiomarina sedimenti]RUO28801.1 hypothetical protein CWE12_10840 [Aliidiomarina sedimenti]